jgi:Heat induced stress protein YflT domain
MMYGRLTVNPISAAWNTVARFDDYSSAQRAVDRLSDDGFPVEQLDIVGSDLQLIERVTGRLTKWRAAAVGALSGLWVGLLIGILLGLFTTGHAWLAMMAVGIGLGLLWGAVFGFVAHLATRGERDFSSLRGLSAAHYDLVAREGGAERARAALEQAGLLPPDLR